MFDLNYLPHFRGPLYTVLILPSAQKQPAKLPNSVTTRIEDRMLDLENDPRPPGCKKLKGREAWRIRVGDYRVIYEIQDNRLIVTVVTIGDRKNVYE